MNSSRNSTLTFSQNTFNSELINEYKIIRDSYLQLKNKISKIFKCNNYLDDLFNIFDTLILFFNQISQTFRTIQEGNEYREQILKNIVKINLEMSENMIINFLNKISVKINTNKNKFINYNNNNLNKKNIVNLKNYFPALKTSSNSNFIKKDNYNKYNNNNYKNNNNNNNIKNKSNINITETNINKKKPTQKFIHKSSSAININENNNNITNNNLNNNNKIHKSINKSISTEINTSILKDNKKKSNNNISKNNINTSPYLSKKKFLIKNKISNLNNNNENNKKSTLNKNNKKNKKSTDDLDLSFLSKKQLKMKRKELKSFDAANSKNFYFNFSFKDLNNSSFLPSERKRLDTYSGVNRQTAASASKKKIYKKHKNNFEENLVSKFHGILDKYNNTNTEQDYIKNTKEYLKNIIEMQKNNNNN